MSAKHWRIFFREAVALAGLASLIGARTGAGAATGVGEVVAGELVDGATRSVCTGGCMHERSQNLLASCDKIAAVVLDVVRAALVVLSAKRPARMRVVKAV